MTFISVFLYEHTIPGKINTNLFFCQMKSDQFRRMRKHLENKKNYNQFSGVLWKINY